MKNLLLVIVVIIVGSIVVDLALAVGGIKITSEMIGDRVASVATLVLHMLWGAILWGFANRRLRWKNG